MPQVLIHLGHRSGGRSMSKWQNEPKFNLKQSHMVFRVVRADSEIP